MDIAASKSRDLSDHINIKILQNMFYSVSLIWGLGLRKSDALLVLYYNIPDYITPYYNISTYHSIKYLLYYYKPAPPNCP